jgi:type IV pilus assembly protein PilX
MNNIKINNQRGVSLLIVLLLLLVMTLLGLASLRGTILGEKSTSNLYDRSLGFQASEAALREAEAVIILTNPTFPASGGCTNGICSAPTGSSADVWTSNSGWRTATVSVGTTTAAPQFIIEPAGQKEKTRDCVALGGTEDECLAPVFRITARSTAADRAQVILQANFVRP